LKKIVLGEPKSAEIRRETVGTIGATAFAGRRCGDRDYPLSSGTSAELDCVLPAYESTSIQYFMHQSRWTRESCLENSGDVSADET